MEAAAVGWGISIAGWIISPYITKLLGKAYDHINPGKPREDLDNLMIHVIPRLRLTLQAAEGGAHKKELERLVKELKSAFEDTEDVLDELQYLDIQSKQRRAYSKKENKQRKSDLKNGDEAGPSNQETRKNDASQKGVTKELECSTSRRTSVIGYLTNIPSMCRDPGQVYMPQPFQSIIVDHIPKDIRGRLVKNVKNIEKLIDKARTTLDIGNAAHIAIGQSNLGSGNRSAEHGENATVRNVEKTSADAPRIVTGRDEVFRQIIEQLYTEDVNPSTSDNTCLPAIGIWGIPGSGKTTLAQYIVKSVKEEKYFDLVMWIHVSKSFSIRDIFKEMFEQASEGGKKCPNSLVVLKEQLKKLLLEKKRILLVLDDIWFTKDIRERGKFEEIISPLMDGKRGNKVLVTSRHRNGVKILGSGVKVIDNSEIPELDDKVFLELFMHHAFGQNIRDATLMNIGREIAQKLKKSPLLAVAVGGILFMERQDVDCWLRVRDQKLLDNNDYMGPLWWCYQHLSEQAKRCFAYCSIFPRTHNLFRDELVNLWVAQGFISSTCIGSKMESVGRDCFNELLSVGFLKLAGGDFIIGQDYFIIHDLMYDLAEMVAGSDCFKLIKDGKTKAPSDVRHLSIENCNASMITEDIIRLGNLRTLIIFDGEDDMSAEVFDKMFRNLTKLRVLIYQGSIEHSEDDMSEEPRSFLFPESIADLRYLRYLGFKIGWGPQVILPARLAKLYLLQVLYLGVCKSLDFSAVENMTNLTNLRHLMNDEEVGFRNIGRLTSLQTIPPFDISRGEGYGLEQLGNLNKLRGMLEINGLESVKSKEEALAAKLADKKGLTELVLDWYDESTPDIQADVLEGLCPPVGLQYMKLYGYGGSRYPSWMVGPQKSTILLKTLVLDSCVNKLPKTINMEHLETLNFSWLRWEELPDDMSLLTSLKRLNIDGCINIRRLPALPTSLESFKISNCSTEFTTSCATEGHPNREKLKNIPRVFIPNYVPYEKVMLL